MNDTGFRFEARVAPDGRIAELTEVSGGGRRSVPPFADTGIAVLSRGRDVIYRFDDERRLRGLPYLDLLEASDKRLA